MRNRTVAAIWVGVIIGVVAIVAVGVGDAWVDTSWHVPSLHGISGMPPDVGRMQRQAIFLRTLHVALDHGVQFVVLSALICMGFARWLFKPVLDAGSAKRVCVRSWRVYLWLLTLVCVLGWNAGFAVEPLPFSDREFVEGEGLSIVGHLVLGLSVFVLPLVAICVGHALERYAVKSGEVPAPIAQATDVRGCDCTDECRCDQDGVSSSCRFECGCGTIPGACDSSSADDVIASNEKEYAACWH